MAGVRYAIAGSPVEHSLSPLLLAIAYVFVAYMDSGPYGPNP